MAVLTNRDINEAVKPLKKSNYFDHIRYGRGFDFEMMMYFSNPGYPKHKTLCIVISLRRGDTSAVMSPFVDGKMKETFLAFTGKKIYEYCLRWIDKVF